MMGLTTRSSTRVVLLIASGVVGCALATAAGVLLQPRFAPAFYESDTILQVGGGGTSAGAGTSRTSTILPQDVQAVTQTINTVEVASEAARIAGADYAKEDFISRCKASQQQDTALIVVSCKAREPEISELQSGAMADAAIAVNDQRLDAQNQAYKDSIDMQKKALEAQLAAENKNIADLTRQGATADKDPRLQIAVTHANQLTQEIDQLNISLIQLPLNRRTALYKVSGPTRLPGPATPTPAEIIAAAAVTGLAVGVEVGLLLTRRRYQPSVRRERHHEVA